MPDPWNWSVAAPAGTPARLKRPARSVTVARCVPATLTLIPPGVEADVTAVAEAEPAAALTVPRIVAGPEGAAGVPPQADATTPTNKRSAAPRSHAPGLMQKPP